MSTRDNALWMLDASEVRVRQTWQHVKTGNRYTIIATGVDEATLTPVVIYAGYDGVVWVRALEVFLGEKDGKPRFMIVDEQDVSTSPFQRTDWRPTDGFEERPS